jgi:hypothetical protein
MTGVLKVFAISALALFVLPGVAKSQSAPPAPAPPKAAPPAAPLTAEEMQEKVLPAFDLQAVRLSDFLDFVSELVPGFQYVIVRDAGVPGDFPTLPSMKLKKVTFGQVMSIIQEAIPQIETHPVESEKGAVVHVFKIHGASGDLGQVQTEMRVYRLADAVDALAARNAPAVPPELNGDPFGAQPAARKKVVDDYHAEVKASQTNALNAVLSLIKAALAQAGDGSVNPVIQVHEETQTLILRGSPNQIGAVQKALEALTPQAVSAPLKEKFAETERRLESQLANSDDQLSRRTAELQRAREEIESLHQEMIKLGVAQERLKLQLEAAKGKR